MAKNVILHRFITGVLVSAFLAPVQAQMVVPTEIAESKVQKALESQENFNDAFRNLWISKCASVANPNAKAVNDEFKKYTARAVYERLHKVHQRYPEIAVKAVRIGLQRKAELRCQTQSAKRVVVPPKAVSSPTKLPLANPDAQNSATYVRGRLGVKDRVLATIRAFQFLSQIPVGYFANLKQPQFEEELFQTMMRIVGIEIPKLKEPVQLKICSANVQFLGMSRLRDNVALTKHYQESGCDVVVMQELVAPPDLTLVPSSPFYNSKVGPTFPDGEALKPNPLNTDFFIEMTKNGYDGVWLSEEDTGTSEKNHSNGTNTEWFVTFYKTALVKPADDLPHGFLSEDRTHNESFDRVPYAFSFRTTDDSADFVLISVHLHPGPGTADRARRKVETEGILKWIETQKAISKERDFAFLGDMNFEDKKELDSILTAGPQFISLNKDAQIMTNTNAASAKPYDHVVFDPNFTKEIKTDDNFLVLNLINDLQDDWAATHTGPYPGNPYNHDLFRFHFSDHHPVMFQLQGLEKDDD